MPDGGYSGSKTRQKARRPSFSLTTDMNNATVGSSSLKSSTIGSFNTAIAVGALLSIREIKAQSLTLGQADLSVTTAIVFSGVNGSPPETSCKYNLVPSQTPRGPIFWENLPGPRLAKIGPSGALT